MKEGVLERKEGLARYVDRKGILERKEGRNRASREEGRITREEGAAREGMELRERMVHAREEDGCKRRRLEKSMYTVLYTTQYTIHSKSR